MAYQSAGSCIRNGASDICNSVAETQSYLCIQKRTNKNTKICLKIIIITQKRKAESGKRKASIATKDTKIIIIITTKMPAIATATKGTMNIIITTMPVTAIATATKGIVTTTRSRRVASWQSSSFRPYCWPLPL